MRFKFTHYTQKHEYVQPEYHRWEAVQKGMSREEVVNLLGSPLHDKYHSGKAQATDPYYTYGYLQMPMLPHPRTYKFLIGFDNDGRVFTKIDPFNGNFSSDGSPTTPEIIIPVANTVFSHYPRILDCRWYPCSGEYPMTYIVELGRCQPFGPQEFEDQEVESELPIPFLMTRFGGAQPGRIRVKARNKVGESPWSDFRHFSFTV